MRAGSDARKPEGSPITGLGADATNKLYHRWLLAHDYALLNPLQIERDDWADLPVESLAPKDVEVQAKRLPHLVHLGEMKIETRIGLLDRIERWQKRGVAFISALLGSDASAEQVVNHFKRQLAQRRPGDRQRWWLRFYDPDVFRHLRWQLRAEQMDCLLGPVAVWSWPDARGQWRRHRRQGDNARIGAPLRLGLEQWARIDRLGLLNRCLRRLASVVSVPEQGEFLWRKVDALLDEAYRVQGLHDDAACILYAEQAIRFHRHIHQHPELYKRLQKAREGQVDYLDACRELDHDAMRVFVAEMEDRNKEDL